MERVKCPFCSKSMLKSKLSYTLTNCYSCKTCKTFNHVSKTTNQVVSSSADHKGVGIKYDFVNNKIELSVFADIMGEPFFTAPHTNKSLNELRQIINNMPGK